MTVGLQGLTAQPLAKVLGLVAPAAEDELSASASEAAEQSLSITAEPGQ